MIPEGERSINKVIGENIEKYFSLSSYTTFTKFCNDIGYAETSRVRKLIAGEVSVSTEKLQLIAFMLNVKTTDLIDDWSE